MIIAGEKVCLREKRLSDALNDYAWQSDPELSRRDAAPPLQISYAQYLLSYTRQLRASSPNRYLFAVETREGEHIGNCTYYNVDHAAGEAEMGIMIGDGNFRDRGYGTDAVKTLVAYIFGNTNLQRIHLKTLDWNERAQRCFARCSFTPAGYRRQDGHRFLLMELHRRQWEKQENHDGQSAGSVASE